MTVALLQLRGTSSQWTLDNRVLLSGQIGFETDTGKFKIGNGISAWTALGYAGGEPIPDAITQYSTLSFYKKPARVYSSIPAVASWATVLENNTISVEIGQNSESGYTAFKSETFTIPLADYSSAATAFRVLNDGDAAGTGFSFGTDNGMLYVEVDENVYPVNDQHVIKITGGTSISDLGFSIGDEGTVANGEWRIIDSENIPAVQNLSDRIDYLEFNSSGGGLSSVRKRVPDYWYVAGPPSILGTGTMTASGAYALIIPNVAANTTITHVGYEITTALSSGSATIDFYIAKSHSSYEYPDIIDGYLGQLTLTSADTTGNKEWTADSSYSCAEDGDYWLIGCLRTGPSPTMRMMQTNTTFWGGFNLSGATAMSSVGRQGYWDAAFPAHASITIGTTVWAGTQMPNNTAPKHAVRVG